MPGEQSRQIVEVYTASRRGLVEELLRVLLGLWLPFIGWRSPEMVRAQSAVTAARVDLALAEARRLARVYAIAAAHDTGASVGRLPSLRESYERSGVGIVDVYERPAKQFLYELSRGATVEAATERATERLVDLVETDVSMTTRDEINKVFEAIPDVIGWRRVLHPELSQNGPCGLCIVAADRFYTKGELLELHDLCKCEPMPITKHADPGLKLNREDLDAIYAAAGGNDMKSLKRIRVTVREHGELGPVLVQDGHHFRDVAEVNRDRKPRTPRFTPYERMSPIAQLEMWDATKQSSERSIARLRAAQAEGVASVDLAGTGRPVELRDIEQAIAYHLELIARANSHLL